MAERPPAPGQSTPDLTPPRFVRPGRQADAPFIAHLQATSMTELLSTVVPGRQWNQIVSESQIQRVWEQTLAAAPGAGQGTLVAEDGAVPVGFASYAVVDGNTEILTLEVVPERRRQGHGSRLLAAIADLARPRRSELTVWIVPDDEARVRFFQSAGFGPDSLRRSLDADGEALVQHLWHANLD